MLVKGDEMDQVVNNQFLANILFLLVKFKKGRLFKKKVSMLKGILT